MFRQSPSEPPAEAPPPLPAGLIPSIGTTNLQSSSGAAQPASPTYTLEDSGLIARRIGPPTAAETANAPSSNNTFAVDAAVYARMSDVVSRPTAEASLEDLRDAIRQMNTLVSLLPVPHGIGPEPRRVTEETLPSFGAIPERSRLGAARATTLASDSLSDSSVSENEGRIRAPPIAFRSDTPDGVGGLGPLIGSASASLRAESSRRRRVAEVYGIVGRGGTYEDAERDIAIANARGVTRPNPPHRRHSSYNIRASALTSGAESPDLDMSLPGFNAPPLPPGGRRSIIPSQPWNEDDLYDLFGDDSDSGDIIAATNTNIPARPVLDMEENMYNEISSSSAMPRVPYDSSTNSAVGAAHSMTLQPRQSNVGGVPPTTNYAITADRTFRRALRALATANGVADSMISSRSPGLRAGRSQSHNIPTFQHRPVPFQPDLLESQDSHIPEDNSISPHPATPTHPRLERLRSTDTHTPDEEPVSPRRETFSPPARAPSPLNPNQPRRTTGARAGLRPASTQSRGQLEAETTGTHAGIRPVTIRPREQSTRQSSVSRAGLRPAVTQSRVQEQQGDSNSRVQISATLTQPRGSSERSTTAGAPLARTQYRDPVADTREPLFVPESGERFSGSSAGGLSRYVSLSEQVLGIDDESENVTALPVSSQQDGAPNIHQEQAIENSVNTLNGDYDQLRGLIDSRRVAYGDGAAARDVAATQSDPSTASMFPLRAEIGRHFDRPIINREIRIRGFAPAAPPVTEYGVPYVPSQVITRNEPERLFPAGTLAGRYEAYLRRPMAAMNPMSRQDIISTAWAGETRAVSLAETDVGFHTQSGGNGESPPRRSRRRAGIRPASAGLSSRVWPDPSTMTREELASWNMVEMAEDREIIEMMRDGSMRERRGQFECREEREDRLEREGRRRRD